MAIATLLVIVAPDPATACSMVDGYQVPTTLELVEQAEAIVLARVGDEIPTKEEYGLGEIELRPEVLIAGSTMPSEIRIRGYHGKGRLQPTPSDPNELSKANPDAFWGGCNRYVFNRGMLLLLFLKRDEAGRMNVIDASFARTLEDVPNAESLWVRAVRYYATVAPLPRDARKAAMKAEIARLRATGNKDDALLAADIDRQVRRKRTQNYD